MNRLPCLVREATSVDLDRIAEISISARGSAGPDQRGAVDDPARLVVVAEVDSSLVGWAKTHHYALADADAPSGHYLGGVSVLPTFRRRGIAAELTRVRLDWIRGRAADAWFFTNARNSASIELHARFGFALVARAAEFHGVKFDGGEGVLFHMTL